MEIKEFVSLTLIDIIEGVRLAQKHAEQVGATVNAGERMASGGIHPHVAASYQDPEPQLIEFEIYVTTADIIDADRGLQVFFPPFSVKSKSQDTSSSQTLNRVCFSIPVVFPRQGNIGQ